MTDLGTDHMLTTAEVAERLRMTEGGLRYWRHIGKGPKSVKSGRRTLYPEQGVIGWLRSLESTSRGEDVQDAEQGAA